MERSGIEMKPSQENRNPLSGLGAKLNLRIGVFFTIFWIAISAIQMSHERELILEQKRVDCEKVLAHTDSVQNYVREVLRPAMFNRVMDEDFIPEAMSSTFVSRSVFERFEKNYPEYYFKLATDNPRNIGNKADEIELEILKRFQEDDEISEWTGVVNREGQPYLLVSKPIWFDTSCMRCHSEPTNAPDELVRRYGDKAGFNRSPGDLAIKSVGIPIGSAIATANLRTAQFSGLAAIFLSGLFFLITLLLNRLVTSPILKLTEGTERFGSGELDFRLKIDSDDEIEDLAKSFNFMAESIQESQMNLEQRVKDRTIALNEKVAELENFNQSMVGREMRMIELKEEINSLCEHLGIEPRYRTGGTDGFDSLTEITEISGGANKR
ncbi:MAG TPA: DUF3365 domain-containing protein [Firmicutes bacterium]|nr:DUF3365 domain-containing protein [Bacillota bacterium]